METEASIISQIETLDKDMEEIRKEISILDRQISKHETEMIGKKLLKDRLKEQLLQLRRKNGVEGY